MRIPAVILLVALPAVAQESALRARLQKTRERVFPALVHILNVEEVFRSGRRKKSVSSGSGFFIDADGHIVTNDHVAGKATQLIVTLANKTKVPAQLIASDPYTDLAVIKVDPKKAFPDGKVATAIFGDSSRIQEGDFVVAMGSPLSLSRSISFGIISCRDRVLSTMRVRGHETGKYNTWLQTDAAINPGNSGGPLVDLDGRVVGVNTRASFMANNIGFAIPSEVAKEVVRALLEHGHVPRSYLGLTLQPLTELDDSALATEGEGVLVAAVASGSPAGRAGIKPGDVIESLNGAPFSARFDEELPGLYRKIARLPRGAPAKLGLKRQTGGAAEIKLTPEGLGRDLGSETAIPEWGLTVRGITKRMALELNLPDTKGVQVTGLRPGSASSGVLSGDMVLLRMQGQEITDLDTFKRIAADLIGKKEKVIRFVLRAGTVVDVAAIQPVYEGKEKG
jgi:serine protease Do